MTLPMFHDAFSGFADLETPRPYDTPEGASAAVGQFEEDLLSGLGDRDLPARTAQAHRLVDDLDATVRTFIAALMPPERATENSDYAVEGAQGARLSLDEQLARLGSDRSVPADDAARFRVMNTTLEQTFQTLLDHLSAARIAEEMDTPTYVERLRGAFKRVRDGSRGQATRLEPHIARAQTVDMRLSIVARIVDILRTKVLARLEDGRQGDADETAALATALERLEGFLSRARAFAEHYRTFLDLSHVSLVRVHRDFASPANMAGAEGESILVSRDIERHAFFRTLPFVWALFITLLVKIVLAHNTAQPLHDLAIPILVLSFVLTWTLSIYIGVWARAHRMRAVQRHTRRQLRNALMAQNADAELIEFPRILPGSTLPRFEPIAPFAYRGHALRHKRRVMTRNLAALAIPAILAALVFITRKEADHDFIARFEGAEPCVLASGRLVFATRNSFFVLPDAAADRPVEQALRRILPELLADVVARTDVIGTDTRADAPPIVQAAEGATEGVRLPDCTEPSRRTQGGGSVTVDLGDTSLEVLAQAVAGGVTPSIVPFDPVIVDARTTIEMELAKSDQGDIDVSAILSALAVVRQRFDNEITLAEALAIVVTGAPTTISSDFRLELPDALLAFLGGEDGQGGLEGEVRGLRLTLASLNDLAVDAVARLELGQEAGNAELVAILDQHLTSLIERQDDLRIALTVGLEAGTGDTFFVTPALLGPSGTSERPADDGVSATIFQTTFTLPGAEGRAEIVDNTLVLPFFPTPVRSGDSSLETPQGAFDWGADARRLNDPVVTEEGTTYFGRIAQTLESCVAGNAVVEVDMIGLASPSWDGPAGDRAAATLNYHLAEGRRVGALRHLADLMNDASGALVRVRIAEGTAVSMAELVAASESVALDAFLARFGRFGSLDAFETRRDTLLGITGLDPATESPLEELFGRSVVLRVVRAEGGPCAF